MKVLVVNDDGINAKGINVLAESLRKNYEVFVLAPHVNRSCSSNCIIMQTALEIEPFKDSQGNQIKNMYSITGFPADCTISGLKSGLFPKIDVVVSGINDCANMGTDIIYSGTCGAARQSTLYGVPAIAVSLSTGGTEPDKSKLKYEAISKFVSDNLPHLALLCGRKDSEVPGECKYFVNINAFSLDSYKGVKLTHPCIREYCDSVELKKKEGDSFSTQFRPGDKMISRFYPELPEENSDYRAVMDGYISISRILSEPGFSMTASSKILDNFVL